MPHFRVQNKQQRAKNQNNQANKQTNTQNIHSKFGLESEQKNSQKKKKQQRNVFEEGLSSLSIRETQIKRIPRLCPTPDIITKLNKAAESKYWGGREKGTFSHTPGGLKNCSRSRNQLGKHSKVKNKSTIWSRYMPQRLDILHLRYQLSQAHCHFMDKIQEMETNLNVLQLINR